MTTVGIVSPGAMGSAFAHVLAQGGARVVATLEGRSERTAALAARAPLELLPDLRAVLAAADVVLSIVPPGEARAVAAEVAQAPSRPLLAELNAIAPATVRALAEGLQLVDGSISGPPPWQPGTTRLYLSGPRADEVAGLGFPGVDVIVVGAEVGLASAVKMSTASVYKGTAALLAHALLTARANGVLEHVVDDLGTPPSLLPEGVERWLAGSATKAARYVAEMEEIAATQAAAGLPPALFEGVAEVYAALASKPAARRAPEDVPAGLTLEDVLAELA